MSQRASKIGLPAESDASVQLATLNRAHRALAEAKTLDDVKQIRDEAEAVRALARSARKGLELQNLAAEIKLRAERKAGQLLIELKLHGGSRKSTLHHARLKLAELGINYTQSHRWQREAEVPDDEFEQYISL